MRNLLILLVLIFVGCSDDTAPREPEPDGEAHERTPNDASTIDGSEEEDLSTPDLPEGMPECFDSKGDCEAPCKTVERTGGICSVNCAQGSFPRYDCPTGWTCSNDCVPSCEEDSDCAEWGLRCVFDVCF